MTRLLIILAIVLLPAAAWGNACKSNVAFGNWSSASSWTDCGDTVPQEADTALVRSGHEIAITATRSIPATTVGATSGTAKLTIGPATYASAIEVTATGALTIDNASGYNGYLTLNPGVTLAMGANNIVVGGTTNNLTSRWDWEINGTATHRVSVTGTGRIVSGGAYARGYVDWEYATFDGFSGDTNTLGLHYGMSILHCRFIGTSNTWSFGSPVKVFNTSNIYFNNNDFRNGQSVNIITNTDDNVTGARRAWDNTFYAPTNANPPAFTLQGSAAYGGKMDVRRNLFYHYRVVETNAELDTFDSNAHYLGGTAVDGASFMAFSGGGSTVSNSIFYGANVNNHGINGSAGYYGNGPNVITRNYFQNLYNSNSANIIIPARLTGTTATYNIFSGTGFFGLTSGLNGSKTVASAAVNTYEYNTFAGLGVGYYWENGTAGVPQNAATNTYNHNIHYGAITSSSIAMMDGNADTINPGGHLDSADYNAFFNVAGVSNDYIDQVELADWTTETRGTIAYASATSFTITTDPPVDLTSTYTAALPLKIRNGTTYAWVLTHDTTPSSYADGVTTVTLNATYGALTASLDQVRYSAGTLTYGTDWGQHDIVGQDPRFINPAVTLASFTGDTAVAFFDNLVTVNGTAVNGTATTATAWNVDSALSYIRNGFTPRNPAYNGYGSQSVAPRTSGGFSDLGFGLEW